MRTLLAFILGITLIHSSHSKSANFLKWIQSESSRDPRSVSINGIEIPVNTEWLTDEQLSELGRSGDENSALQSIRKFYDELEAETKKHAAENITKECYSWLSTVTSDDERAQLNELHETNHDECKKKVAEFMKRLDEDKQKQMEKYWSFCEHVWYEHHHQPADQEHSEHAEHQEHNDEHKHHDHAHRRRRRNAETFDAEKLEELLRNYLSWLTDDQKDQVRTMRTEGKSRDEIRGEVLKFYNQLEGQAKETAGEQLKAGCRSILREIIGEDRANELKEMRESGATPADIGKKVDEFLAIVEDVEKQKKAKALGPTCKMLFGIPHETTSTRRRRDHHEGHHEGHHGGHGFEDYFKTHLSWLTDAQKEALKALKSAGKTRLELQNKAMEYYDELTGEAKEKATALMQSGCKELSKYLLGEEKAVEFKQLYESGVPVDQISKKIDEAIAMMSDGKKKTLAQEYRPMCKKFFGAQKSSRRKRDHHHPHSLEDVFKTHLSWLTDAQKEELRSAKATGSPRSEIQKKINEFYSQLSGEAKERATAQLQDACRDLLRWVFGEEKANELKQMRESGTAYNEISKKVEELADKLDDEHKKVIVDEYTPYCRKVFGVPSRMRRSYQSFQKYADLRNKALNEDTDTENEEDGASIYARSSNRDRQQSHGRSRSEDADVDDGTITISSDNDQEIEESDDGAARTAAAAADAERDDYELEGENDRPHNSWMTTEQKKKVKNWREEGKSEAEIHSGIHEMFDVSDGTVKMLARGILEKGCEAILERIFGQDEAQEILSMRKSGTPNSEIDQRIANAVSEIRDEDERQEAGKYALTCRQILGFVMRKKRATGDTEIPPQFALDEVLKTHLSWLSDEQKEQLKALKAEGKSRAELRAKTMEFFEATTGEERKKASQHLYNGCREILAAVIGKENAEELKSMRESGSTTEQLDAKANGYLAAVQDEKLKAIANEFSPNCREIFLNHSPVGRNRRSLGNLFTNAAASNSEECD